MDRNDDDDDDDGGLDESSSWLVWRPDREASELMRGDSLLGQPDDEEPMEVDELFRLANCDMAVERMVEESEASKDCGSLWLDE